MNQCVASWWNGASLGISLLCDALLDALPNMSSGFDVSLVKLMFKIHSLSLIECSKKARMASWIVGKWTLRGATEYVHRMSLLVSSFTAWIFTLGALEMDALN